MPELVQQVTTNLTHSQQNKTYTNTELIPTGGEILIINREKRNTKEKRRKM